MEVNAKEMGSLENAIINDHDSTDTTQTGQSSIEASLPQYIQDALMKSLDNAQKLGRKFSFSQAITDRAASHLRQLYRKNSRMCPKVAAAASVYTACRQEGNARSMKELCSASKIGLGKLGKAYKEIARILEIQLDRFTADDFIPRFCADLNLSSKVQKFAKHLVFQFLNLKGVHHTANCLSASAVFTAARTLGESCSLDDISEVSKITSSTVKNISREICMNTTILVNFNGCRDECCSPPKSCT